MARSRVAGPTLAGLVLTMALPGPAAAPSGRSTSAEAQAAAPADSSNLRARAFGLAYNLDYEEALALLDEGRRAHPEDPAIHRAVATISWLRILFARGSVTVDDYLGALSRQTVPVEPPAAALVEPFMTSAARAIDLAQHRIDADRRNASAYYELGAAVGLMASYTATVEGRVLGGLRAARRAYDAHERVLELDPGRKDAGLIVGTYRYVVGSLSWPMRVLAYLAGFGGDKMLGLKMIEEAAAFPSDAQADARFALVLLYNREGRHADALAQLARLQQQFPANRLLWLEAGATALRAGRPREAIDQLHAGFEKLANDPRPRMFGEDGLWHHKQGLARLAVGDREGALADLHTALQGESRAWVRGRTELELARIAMSTGAAAEAQDRLQKAVTLCKRDNDPAGEREARRLLKDLSTAR